MSLRRSRGIHAARPTPRRLRLACTQFAICVVWEIARLEAKAEGRADADADANATVLSCSSPAVRHAGGSDLSYVTAGKPYCHRFRGVPGFRVEHLTLWELLEPCDSRDSQSQNQYHRKNECTQTSKRRRTLKPQPLTGPRMGKGQHACMQTQPRISRQCLGVRIQPVPQQRMPDR
jgi:hypothetical protein